MNDVSFGLNSNSHDFGVCYDLMVEVNPENDRAIKNLEKLSDVFPSCWDAESMAELHLLN